MLSLSVYHKNRRQAGSKNESGREIGNSLEFDFVVPSAQLSRASLELEANNYLGNLLSKSYLPPQSSALSTQPLHLARQSKNN